MSETGGLPGDPRFFPRRGPFTLAEVAKAAGAELNGEGGTRRFRGIAPLQAAEADEISFLDNRKYLGLLAETRAGAVILRGEYAARLPAGCRALVSAEPYLAWARAGTLFHPPAPASPGRHPSAIVDPAATIDDSAEIGPGAVIGAAAEIGPRCRIGALAVIGPGVRIGADCRIGPHVTIGHALIGDRVTLHPGVRIGQDGFGFATGPDGFVDVPQVGRVVVEHDVDIGANTTIDRGALHDTVIGAGSRIDNLVQIGHNARLGRCCVVVSQAGISGSAVLEDFVVLAGQAGISGHLTLGKGSRVGPQAGVMSDIPAGADVLGSPAQPIKAFMREVAALRRFARRGGMRHSGETPEDGKSGNAT